MDIAGLLQYEPFLLALVVWDLVWRGLALWKSAQLKQKYWFVAILVLNTLGVLPIVYLILQKKTKKA